MRSPIGEKIEDFEFCGKIGSGGFAEVFKAKCLQPGYDDRYVAIKRISKNCIKKKKCERRIKAEIDIHSQLSHPAIVKFYTSFEDEVYIYLVLELCDGGSLEKFIENKCYLSEGKACSLIKQVIDGVQYLHFNSIIHRDLSLRNILLTHDGDVKIADFGLAVKCRPNEKKTSVLGTANFMSPEVVMRGPYDFKVDCWSVGCVLYALLYGAPPFNDKKKKCIMNGAVKSEPTFPDNASSEAIEFLKDMLNKDPKERIEIKSTLQYAFFQKYESAKKYESKSQRSGDSGMGSTSSSSRSIRKIKGYSDKDGKNSYNCPPTNCQRYYSGHSNGSTRSMNQLDDNRTELRAIIKSNNHRNDDSGRSSRSSSKSQSVQKMKGSSDKEVRNKYDCRTAIDPQIFYCSNSNCSTRSENEQNCYSTRKGKQRAKSPKPTKNEYVSGSINQLKNKIPPLPSYQDIYNLYLSKQAHPNARVYENYNGKEIRNELSKDGEIFNHDNILESQFDVPVRSCPPNPSYPLHLQNLSEGNMNINSYYSCTIDIDDNKSCGSTYRQKNCITRTNSQDNILKYSTSNKRTKTIIIPLTTARLLPQKYITKNIAVSILTDGQVCVESLKNGCITDVCFISHDGMMVNIYKPKKEILISDEPPSIECMQEEHNFTFENLLKAPKAYRKKYQKAKCFIDIVRAKTPKVIIYGPKAKCVMMENTPNPDYEMNFYDDSKITEIGGKMYQNGMNLENNYDADTEFMLNEFASMKEKCRKLEAFLETHSNLGDFPVTLGSRPNALSKNLESSKENATPKSINSSSMNRAMQSYNSITNTDSSPYTNSFQVRMQSPLSNKNSNHIQITSSPLENIKEILPHLKGQPLVKKGWVIAEYVDGIEMWISRNEQDVFFRDSHTKQSLPNDLHQELMKRFHRDVCSVLLNAISEVKRTK